MIFDAQGHAVSGATAESVALYDQAVRAYNLGYGDAQKLFPRNPRLAFEDACRIE